MSGKLVLVNKLARASMESTELLELVYELCDNSFSQDISIHKLVYNVERLFQLLVRYYSASAGNDYQKKLGHQFRATK